MKKLFAVALLLLLAACSDQDRLAIGSALTGMSQGIRAATPPTTTTDCDQSLTGRYISCTTH